MHDDDKTTTATTAAPGDDPEIAVAVEVLEDLLHLVEPDKRLEVLTTAVAKEEVAREKREVSKLDWMSMDEASMAAYRASPGFRYWNRIMRFKSLIIQVFTRDITNDHSAEDAAKILFTQHRNGNGSGWLPDYLDGLPALKVDLKKAASISGGA
jgi:hypothetical protein